MGEEVAEEDVQFVRQHTAKLILAESQNIHQKEKGHPHSEIQFECVSADSDSLD
jgi:hypothetical protein